MPLLVKDIQEPYTADELKAFLLEQLSVAGFPVTAWQDEGGARSFVEASAAVGAQLSTIISNLAKATYLDDASGKLLQKKTESDFDEPVSPATRAVFPVSFVNSGVSNHVLTARQLTLRASNGKEFTNSVGVTITNSTTTISQVEAKEPGSDGNVPAQTLELVTPLAGVIAEYLGVATSVGADEESDGKLKERARSKWGALRVTKIRAGVENLVRNAAPNVFSVGIDDQNPRGPGTVDVYLAGENATAGGGDVALAQAALDLAFFGNGTEDQQVKAFPAPTLATNLAMTVYYSGVDETALVTALEERWRVFLAAVPIGGFDLRPGPEHILLQSQITDELGDEPGIEALVITSPAVTTSVPINTKLIEGTITIIAVAVNSGS